MNPSTQGPASGAPDTYVWQVPGKPVAVHIPLTIVDQLSVELMKGYGTNPKRSPELGGVLIGSIKEGTPTIVRVEDFELVPCQYRRGPSYTFTEEDCGPFELAGTRSDGIGYFRTHTREGLSLGAEDIDLLDHFFAGPYTVALLVKPFATKVSQAGLFIRENGVFPEKTPLEFPFRRQELSGQEAPARRSMMERRPKLRDLDPSSPRRVRGMQEGFPPIGGIADGAGNPGMGNPLAGGGSERAPQQTPPAPLPPVNPGADAGAPMFAQGQAVPQETPDRALNMETPKALTSPAMTHNRWVWVPVSFVFLLLGLGLRFQAALTYGSRPLNLSAKDFALGLSVARTDQTLTLTWDRQAHAVRAAKRGVLEIEEQGISKPVELDAAQLANGTLIYRNVSDNVHFKLSVFPAEGLGISQFAEWRRQ
jgi:hypothetical protein